MPCKNCGRGFNLPINYAEANSLRDFCPECILSLYNTGRLEEAVLGPAPVIVQPWYGEAELP